MSRFFLQEIHNKKGFQFNIPYAKHSIFFQEAIACTKEQVSILSHSDISLQQLFEVINRQFSQTLIKSSPVGQAKLLDGKLFAALYVNDVVTVKKVLEEVNRSSETWLPDLFEWKYGKLDVWLQGLQETISNRDEFLKQIEINTQDKKMSALHNFEITL